MDRQGDEFEQYRSRAYSAGSRFRHTQSLPGTPRVRKYTGFHSHSGPKGDAEVQGNFVKGFVQDDGTLLLVSSMRSSGDGQEAEQVTIAQSGQSHLSMRNELEPLRRAVSMKHHRNRTRPGSSPVPPSTPSSSPALAMPSSMSPPGRTDSPTPNSWRGRSPNRPKDLDLGRAMRPRTSSMPARSHVKRPDLSRYRTTRTNHIDEPFPETFSAEDTGPSGVRRVRSFKTTSKGIINRGDSFKMRGSQSQASLDSIGNPKDAAVGIRPRTFSNTSSKDSGGYSRTPSLEQEASVYKVIVVGGQGVGKTSLTQQFMTSEYMGHVDSTTDDDEDERTISVLLDGEESTMLFIDASGEEDPCISIQLMPNADAYVVVYSVADRESFDEAIEVLHEIAKDKQRSPPAVILVANKGDIVRNRTVTEDEAKTMAVRYDVKYIEVSVVLNHKVDELLGGVLSQIRLKQRSRRKTKCLPEPDNGCVQGAARGIIGKLFKNHPYMFRSCDNLMVL